MGNGLLNLRDISLGLRLWCRCWCRRRLALLLEEIKGVSCLYNRPLSFSNDSRRMITWVDLRQVLQGALRTRTRTDWVVQKVQKVHLLFSFVGCACSCFFNSSPTALVIFNSFSSCAC